MSDIFLKSRHLWSVRLLAAAGVLTLVACQEPTTRMPGLSPEEIRSEQEAQQRIVNDAKNAPTPPVTKNEEELRIQFQRVGLRLREAGAKVCQTLNAPNPERQCDFPFAIEQNPELNAYADGSKVVVYTGMLQFLQSDEEVAAILSHEYAHNVMGHVAAAQQNSALGGIAGTLADSLAASQGLNTGGGFSQLGAQYAVLKYSVSFEQEADYVGLYILANAGYDITKVPDIWRRMSIGNPKAIYTASTHPSHAQRYVALQKTISEINNKKASGAPLLPEFKKSAK